MSFTKTTVSIVLILYCRITDLVETVEVTYKEVEYCPTNSILIARARRRYLNLTLEKIRKCTLLDVPM